MASSRNQNIIKYVIPTMLGSVCFFMFTIVDGIFVGHGVGTDALGAVNLVMPFVMVVNALFMLATIGGVTIVAIRLGKGDEKGANQAFMHSITIAILISVVLCALGTLCTDALCRLMGANDTFFEMTREYLFWYSVFIIPSGMSTALQGFCRNDGSPVLVSAAVVTGTVCNIFGDWLLIFPMQMGLAGAAIATGVSQTVTFLIVLSHFLRRQGVLRFSRYRADRVLFGEVALRGLPECIAQFATPVTTLWMNSVLIAQIGDVAVNAYSIISYVASFSVAIFFGTAEGLQPLFGHCYGSKDEESLHYYFKAGILINFFGSVIINLLLLVVGGSVCQLFGTDADTLQFTVQSMPLYAWGFIVMSFNTIISAYLYSTTRTKQAVIINTLRSLIVNTLVIRILPAVFGKGIIWFTFGIYEAIVLVVAVILVRRAERRRLT
nr:MATE family efflux transporter [uncultured Oscillibacter sp.]